MAVDHTTIKGDIDGGRDECDSVLAYRLIEVRVDLLCGGWISCGPQMDDAVYPFQNPAKGWQQRRAGGGSSRSEAG